MFESVWKSKFKQLDIKRKKHLNTEISIAKTIDSPNLNFEDTVINGVV